jgi:multicomponent Na+:H+ antiporter subunit F
MINVALNIVLICLALLGVLSLYRALKGPTTMDRIAAMNMIVTMVVLFTVIFSYQIGNFLYLDIALVFILASYIATICILKCLREGRLF